ncbi:MAG: dihydroorotase, multifunctional complex type [Ignavibacteria bacterium]|nr:dihydroorotase, multifunctional complex type [Ignavibacteria bacterium]
MINILFKQIRAVNPAENLDKIVNLWIKEGNIIHCSDKPVDVENDTQIIDGSDLIAAPGFCDMHVHLREPGYEYKENIVSGTAAAVNGGFTAVVCMPNTEPPIDNVPVVEFIRNQAAHLPVSVYIAGALTQKREGKHISCMYELSDSGVLMFTDDGNCVTDSDVMRRIFEYSSGRDLLISQHCEEHSLTNSFAMNEGIHSAKLGLKGYPSVAEEIILSRDIMLSGYFNNRRYHASHISTGHSVDLIRNAKAQGLRVSCEVTPHHFCLTEDYLSGYDTNYKMNPPLRTKKDVDALLTGLSDGTIDCIATDHAPHALHEKNIEFEKASCGIIGLETSFGLSMTFLVHKGILSIHQLIEKMSCNPRKILGLRDISMKEGSCAEITIFAPDKEWTVDKTKFKSRSDNTPFDGWHLKGKPEYVINGNYFIKSEL